MKNLRVRVALFGALLASAFGAHAQFIQNTGITISNSAALYTNGDWNNAAGSVFIQNGTLATNSAFTNLGTLDVASTGGFILDYATDITFAPGGGRFGFLVKQGVGKALSSGSYTVKDSLFLTNGLIVLQNANDTITAPATAIVAANPSSYVEGKFARTGTGTVLFPIGRDGRYLPVSIIRMQASRATASVNPAPANIVRGPGVEALINFPYVWEVREKTASDTAAYVEVNYPNTLPVATNAIIIRRQASPQFVSMGARLIENSTTTNRATVRSYSRGLNGVFSVAQGFPGDFRTDSLALVALYQTTGGANWTNKTNWLSTPVSNWFGVTVNGNSITNVSLPNNNLRGNMADQLVDILSLRSVNVSNNALTAIPNFTDNKEITLLNVSGNRLTFGSLEPNITVPGLSYANQGRYGSARRDSVAVNSPYTFNGEAGGTSTAYSWRRNGQVVANATGKSYSLNAVTRANMGDYETVATNSRVPNLTLTSNVQTVLATANISGTLFATPTQTASGTVTLFRVTPGKYDTTQVLKIGSNGVFDLKKVVLDDYQLLGFPDPLIYEKALPTYYDNTIFWEEAKTISLQGSVSGFKIVGTEEPPPPTGQGAIIGTLFETVESSNGRVQNKRAVAGAGVAARRVQTTGRGQEEQLILVAYVFTDENGEFDLSFLPPGPYRLNIQYPGYPMDPTSFINITIGTGFQSTAVVEAEVQQGKIAVRKVLITGLGEYDDYAVQVYPNPTTDFVHLKFHAPAQSRGVALSNFNGQLLRSQTANESESTIDLRSLAKGVYLLKISDSNRVVKTLKIVIEN